MKGKIGSVRANETRELTRERCANEGDTPAHWRLQRGRP
jgi:hypothetical protein